MLLALAITIIVVSLLLGVWLYEWKPGEPITIRSVVVDLISGLFHLGLALIRVWMIMIALLVLCWAIIYVVVAITDHFHRSWPS